MKILYFIFGEEGNLWKRSQQNIILEKTFFKINVVFLQVKCVDAYVDKKLRKVRPPPTYIFGLHLFWNAL